MTSSLIAPRRILVVDDSAVFRSILCTYLSGEALELVQAGNGVEAMSALQAHPVSLVLADVQMDEMDGLALTRAIRASGDKAIRILPIILITADRDPSRSDEARRAGADALLQKPLGVTTLRQKVRELLGEGA